MIKKRPVELRMVTLKKKKDALAGKVFFYGKLVDEIHHEIMPLS
jgi:hypothetical protein